MRTFKNIHSKYICLFSKICFADFTRNSSGDEIANVNFFHDDIVHAEASAYAH